MIRNDFVSNSSSTSFMIVGYCSNYDEVLDRMKELGIDTEDETSLYWLCTKLLENTHADLAFERDIGDDPYNCWFGLNYTAMNENETRGQFEERILTEVKKIFPKATMKDIVYECQGGRDG